MPVGYIYRIVNSVNDQLYIGSTAKGLLQRFAVHQAHFKSKEAKALYYASFEILKFEGARIELIEEVRFELREELYKRERYWIEHYKGIGRCVNIVIPGRSTQEQRRAYYEANEERIKEQQRAYYEANEERIKEQKRAYYQANEELIKEKRRAYYEANEERIKEQKRAYYEANKDRQRAYYEANKERKRAYYEANKDRQRAYYEANKERIKERQRAYYEAKSKSSE